MSRSLRVVVTGGASGIGAAIAQRFLEDGARVSVGDQDPEAVHRAVRANPELLGAVADVASPDDVDRWLDDVTQRWGGVDVLVNNAGIAGPTAPVEDVTIEDWRRCLSVGLDSQFLTCRKIVPLMKQQREGSVITIASTAGLYGYGMRTPYASAKWAVIGFTKSLAVELGPYGVRANAICPGSVAGPRMAQVIQAEAKAWGLDPSLVSRRYVEGQSIARFVEPSEVADLCLFLSSPGARMISGQVIAVDGHTQTFPTGPIARA